MVHGTQAESGTCTAVGRQFDRSPRPQSGGGGGGLLTCRHGNRSSLTTSQIALSGWIPYKCRCKRIIYFLSLFSGFKVVFSLKYNLGVDTVIKISKLLTTKQILLIVKIPHFQSFLNLMNQTKIQIKVMNQKMHF